MAERERISLEEFKTTDIRRGNVRRFITTRTDVGAASRRRGGLGSMVTKLAICATAVMLVLGICAVNAISASGDELEDTDEGLFGRLKFVSIPGIIDVFGSIGEMEAPVSYTNVELMQNGMLARFISTENAQVYCVKDGVVIAVSEDPLLGNYVTVMHDDDISTTYYGLGSVRCEINQPLKRKDSIGSLGSIPSLYFKIVKQGEIQQITDYIDINDLR
ncbi:MAG: M23 family metallopeptidase [Clostridia bacterium]|nr:M23 family metallopeptidase [Clostridia bacterium]